MKTEQLMGLQRRGASWSASRSSGRTPDREPPASSPVLDPEVIARFRLIVSRNVVAEIS